MNAKAYLPFAGAGIQSSLAYKWNFLGFFIGEIFSSFVMYFLWRAVYAHSGGGAINGFSMMDMTVYIFVSNITGFLTFSDVSYAVGEEILDGSISMRLIKPVNYELSLIFQELGSKLVTFALVLVPVFACVEAYRFVATGAICFSAARFALYLASMTLSYFILFYFDLCFGFLAFAVKNLWGFNMLKGNIVGFLSGSIIPLAFYPGWALPILDFMPFASMGYTPVMIYTGMYDARMIALSIARQILWVAILWTASKIVWHATVKHLTVQGG